MIKAFLFGIAALGLLAIPAAAQPKTDPDWPCVQRKVPRSLFRHLSPKQPRDPFEHGDKLDKENEELLALEESKLG